MDQEALIERRTRLERRRNAELGACLAKWRSSINSVDLLLRAAAIVDDVSSPTESGQASPVRLLANALEGTAKREPKESMMEVVRQTLHHHQGFLTARTLAELINKTERISVTARGISPLLRSLCKLGEIRLVEKGKGRKPHMYLKL
jgi:hypothetical protein